MNEDLSPVLYLTGYCVFVLSVVLFYFVSLGVQRLYARLQARHPPALTIRNQGVQASNQATAWMQQETSPLPLRQRLVRARENGRAFAEVAEEVRRQALDIDRMLASLGDYEAQLEDQVDERC